jgi:hypothetical protein
MQTGSARYLSAILLVIHSRTHIYGLDFSGAQNAGRHIWMARGVLRDASLHILDCQSAEMLFGSSSRETVMSHLRDMIATSGAALWGCDFPFSLHHTQLHAANWLDFALQLESRFPTAESFYAALGGKGNELRRQCDLDAGTPMPATNLRLYRQTYYGIRDILALLVANGKATVTPMQAPQADTPILIEICPAITLKRLSLRLTRYKEGNDEGYKRRLQIVEGLDANGVTFASAELRQRVIGNGRGDALDSVIAAFTAARALLSGVLEQEVAGIYRLEGVIYG